MDPFFVSMLGLEILFILMDIAFFVIDIILYRKSHSKFTLVCAGICAIGAVVVTAFMVNLIKNYV